LPGFSEAVIENIQLMEKEGMLTALSAIQTKLAV